MPGTEPASRSLSILVVSYSGETREALAASLAASHAGAVVCETFRQAEDLALAGRYNGLLVDLPSMVKAKGEEKIVACTLANFFPCLRVRAIGSALVPMAMPGGARQDGSLNDFLTKTCPAFVPRALRAHRRHAICAQTLLVWQGEEVRGVTLNISWGGAFIMDTRAERFQTGEQVTVRFPRCGGTARAIIRRVVPWGMENPPGIGVSFQEMDQTLETALAGILKTRREFDRDRLVA